MLGLDVDPVIPDESPDAATPSTCAQQHSRITKRILTAVERVVFTLLSVTVSILVPEFSSMMAFLGSFSAFMICVIGPISAKVALASRCGMFDALLLTAAIVMATWGTVAAFWA
jgi:solute carrier family 32 (vesicular inhibitory amino acid transporter)